LQIEAAVALTELDAQVMAPGREGDFQLLTIATGRDHRLAVYQQPAAVVGLYADAQRAGAACLDLAFPDDTEVARRAGQHRGEVNGIARPGLVRFELGKIG
jgi:hypothetical protein